MPPPYLIFNNSSPPQQYLSPDAADFIPSYVPGTRRLAQPIPIESAHPSTEPQSYSLGSQDSIMSDISDWLRPSPPPLTATSALPTPFTLRTPATTSASAATARPVITSPVSPSAEHASAENGENGLVRVKSFPHSGNLLESPGEAGRSRRASPTGIGYNSGDEDMDVDVDDDRQTTGVVEEAAPGAHAQGWSESDYLDRPEPSAPRGSLTRLLRDIGNSPPTQSTQSPALIPAYIQPMLNDRATILGSRWSQPVASTSSSSSTSRETSRREQALRQRSNGAVPELQGPGPFNELGPHPTSHGDEAQFARYGTQPYTQSVNYHPTTSGGFLPGEWGEAFTSHPSTASREENLANRSYFPPFFATSAPVSASPSSTSTDFRTIPSPVADTSAGSPSAVERRLDTIESRLARARAQRSPPTPPGLIHGHIYEGMRSRGTASRPYDLASRSRPSSQVADDGSRRSSFSRSAIRPSWLEQPSTSASSSSATVPPPRPRPTASFGWETTDTQPFTSARSFSGSDRPTQALARHNVAQNGYPQSAQQDAGLRYPHARRNVTDSASTGRFSTSPVRAFGTDAWPPAMAHHADDSSATSERHRRPMANLNLPTWLGYTPSSDPPLNTRSESYSRIINDIDIAHPSYGPEPWEPEPTRPANRRWISFDEGRENSRTRAEAHDAQEQSDLGALNRDVNEVIGRRLSQPRPRPASVTRRLRDHLGPDWEDTSVPDTASSSASSGAPGLPTHPAAAQARRDRPSSDSQPVRSRIGNLFGETADTHEPTDPLDMYLGRDRSNTSSPADELAAFIDRRRRDRPALSYAPLLPPDGEGAELLFLDRLRSWNNLNARHGDFASLRNGYEGLEGLFDVSSESPFAHLDAMRRIDNLYAAPPMGLHSMKITKDMDSSEKLKIVQLVIRGVSKLPTTVRKRAAESTLRSMKYGNFEDGDNLKLVEGLQKDEYCSVCHDDYEAESEITITPCKHMYHKGCLDTWLNNPSTSSCPMCRRDLAALAYLTKMVPTKEVDEALPLWMAVVV
ncbi:uncharacterized protein I303_100233 [Kwoniella dejecticola CBS 10117]|uniref:RING-type domain-containing protein n=1 Tax=Kwoniella dejecticola CBS 10117 TaxID=1296121 RepID=A0A1A6AEG7_9TREE|nr:uncharacterized protein I303_00235 [Kwoniella dejecticola CBS 10117]OBR88418.1 hypothetical protein I303_00235 [Kwoniella dejecticola CBS 10117]